MDILFFLANLTTPLIGKEREKGVLMLCDGYVWIVMVESDMNRDQHIERDILRVCRSYVSAKEFVESNASANLEEDTIVFEWLNHISFYIENNDGSFIRYTLISAPFYE